MLSFSEQNNLINNDNYSENFRVSIFQTFLDSFSTESQKIAALKNVMNFFGLQQYTSLTHLDDLNKNISICIDYFKCCDYNKLFDFIHFILQTPELNINKKIIRQYNELFRYYWYNYIIIDNCVIPMLAQQEVDMINNALNTNYESVNNTYSEAVDFLSNKDYNNAVLKVANSLEAMLNVILQSKGLNHKNTTKPLGDAIKILKKSGIVFDAQIENIISNCYYYACKPGIRHGGVNNIEVSANDALYIVTLGATLINYLKNLLEESNEIETRVSEKVEK